MGGWVGELTLTNPSRSLGRPQTERTWSLFKGEASEEVGGWVGGWVERLTNHPYIGGWVGGWGGWVGGWVGG